MVKQFKDAILLEHVLDAITAIEKFTKGVSVERFNEDDLIQSAVIRQFEIIGEATKGLSENFRNNHSDIPWKKIAGLRDKLIHNYFGIELEVVWDTVHNDLPILKKQLLPLVEQLMRVSNRKAATASPLITTN